MTDRRPKKPLALVRPDKKDVVKSLVGPKFSDSRKLDSTVEGCDISIHRGAVCGALAPHTRLDAMGSNENAASSTGSVYKIRSNITVSGGSYRSNCVPKQREAASPVRRIWPRTARSTFAALASLLQQMAIPPCLTSSVVRRRFIIRRLCMSIILANGSAQCEVSLTRFWSSDVRTSYTVFMASASRRKR